MTIFDEEDCLKAISKDDERSFDTLFRHYFPKIKAFMAHLIQNEEDAEDLAQDIFIRLWHNRKEAQHIRNLDAYLFKTSRNEVYQHIRRNLLFDKYSQEVGHTAGGESEVFNVVDTIYAEELEETIGKVVAKMPSQRQKIYLMSRKEKKSNAEIAEVLNINKRTVENHLTLALADIRKVILSYFLYLFL